LTWASTDCQGPNNNNRPVNQILIHAKLEHTEVDYISMSFFILHSRSISLLFRLVVASSILAEKEKDMDEATARRNKSEIELK